MAEAESKLILIDTNIFIDHLRNYTPAVQYIEKIEIKNVLFSAITEAELLAGSENNDATKREKLLFLLLQWTKIPITNPIALLAGDLSRKYDMDIPDALIAASAIKNNAALITRNLKDFRKVPDLKLELPY